MRPFVRFMMIFAFVFVFSLGYSSVTAAAGEQTFQAGTFQELKAAVQKIKQKGTIEITANIIVSDLIEIGKKSVIIRSGGANAFTLERAKDYSGFIFYIVGQGSSLSLEKIVLDGRKDIFTEYTERFIYVDKKGSLTIRAGAVLQNNKAGAVEVWRDSKLTMIGGSIENNDYGGLRFSSSTL